MTTHPTTSAVDALRRIAEATPNSTNSGTAKQMASWTQSVARTALAALEQGDGHASDCATNNAPAMEPGPCDCGEASAVEALADAWASIDGKLAEFRSGGDHGRREGYLHEAGEMIERLAKRGFTVAPIAALEKGEADV